MMETIGNRLLHWAAALGIFLLADSVGVQQLAADYLQAVSYKISTSK